MNEYNLKLTEEEIKVAAIYLTQCLPRLREIADSDAHQHGLDVLMEDLKNKNKEVDRETLMYIFLDNHKKIITDVVNKLNEYETKTIKHNGNNWSSSVSDYFNSLFHKGGPKQKAD